MNKETYKSRDIAEKDYLRYIQICRDIKELEHKLIILKIDKKKLELKFGKM